MFKIRNVSDFRGAGRLTIDAICVITDLTEDLHCAIASVGGKLGARNQHRTKGITGFVYRNIRTVSGLVGGAIDAVLGKLDNLLGETDPGSGRETVLAALNGVPGRLSGSFEQSAEHSHGAAPEWHSVAHG